MNKILVSIVFLCVILHAQSNVPQGEPKIKEKIKSEIDHKIDSHFAKVNKMLPSDTVTEDVASIKKILKNMKDVDQAILLFSRDLWWDKKYSEEEKRYIQVKMTPLWQNQGKKHTEKLKEILKVYRWITISQFGKEASMQAWLLVQHSDWDLELQKRVLKILEELYPKNEVDPQHYAYLYDRVATAEKRKQRFGTQGNVTNGKWQPYPIEDMENLNKRRAEFGMGTFEEYQSQFK